MNPNLNDDCFGFLAFQLVLGSQRKRNGFAHASALTWVVISLTLIEQLLCISPHIYSIWNWRVQQNEWKNHSCSCSSWDGVGCPHTRLVKITYKIPDLPNSLFSPLTLPAVVSIYCTVESIMFCVLSLMSCLTNDRCSSFHSLAKKQQNTTQTYTVTALSEGYGSYFFPTACHDE